MKNIQNYSNCSKQNFEKTKIFMKKTKFCITAQISQKLKKK